MLLNKAVYRRLSNVFNKAFIGDCPMLLSKADYRKLSNVF